jgi:putative membrane protein
MSFLGPESLFWVFGLIPLLFWVAVIWIIVLLVRRRDQPPVTPYPSEFPSSQPRALDTLEERYARGEISRDEFLERRAVLLGEVQPVPPTQPVASESPGLELPVPEPPAPEPQAPPPLKT